MPNARHPTKRQLWIRSIRLLSGSAFLCLLALVWKIDTELQQQRFDHDALTVKQHLTELELKTQLALNQRVHSDFDPERDLINLLASLPESTWYHQVTVAQADGTYYASNAGNPLYGLLVTDDDTDHAATPLVATQEPWWQYYFLTGVQHDPRLWPSRVEEHPMLLTFSVDLQNPTKQWVFVFSFSLEDLLSTLESQPVALEYVGAKMLNREPERWSQPINELWVLTTRPSLPWLPIIVFCFAVLFYLLSRQASKAKNKQEHPFRHILPALGEELKVLIFETDQHTNVIWREGSVDCEALFFNSQPGDSIRQRLLAQPRYLAYWQHTMSGEKFTYEFQYDEQWFRVHQFPIQDKHQHYLGTSVLVEDISNIREIEDQLRHQQFHDTLTGLPNRQLFMEQLLHEISRSKRRQENMAVLALEISGIGEINRRYGHKVSDELLRTIADSFKTILRTDDSLCRFSNDEFLFTFSDYHQPEQLRQVAQRLIDTATATVHIETHELNLFANVGIATFPRDARDAGSLVSNAITAMRHARQTGRNRLDYFSEDNARMVQEKWQLEQDLSKAINAHDFELHYQPIFELQTHQCVAAEALLRWPNTKLAPDQFIPLAEETGLIHKLGLFVIESSLKQLMQWKNDGSDIHYISVNLSVMQLEDIHFFPQLEKVIRDYPFEPGQIVLEITESVMMNTDPATVRKLQRLKDMGFRLAIDDFGTGFSSLNYLKHLPVNFVKVDRSFVQGVCDDPQDAAICEAIIQMTITMDLHLIAEGVETPEQMNWLGQKGVNYAQGYFYARAVPANQFKPYLGLA